MILAFDFGGTKNTCAAFTRNDAGAYQLVALERRASPPHADGAYDYAVMRDLARGLLQGKTPSAIGVSFGGLVRASQGLVVLSHHVAGWENIFLRDRLAAEFQTRVELDNDANVAALGEARFGAGRDCANLLYITVSTGVGGGWILDGKPYRGANELAGEIGHTVIDPHGPPCMCGRRGCVEQMASGRAIARMARQALERDPRRGEILRARIDNDLTRLTGLVVHQADLAGDALARELMTHAARSLGFAIGNMLCLMNPARVILGGGVTHAGEHYFENVRAAARANVIPELRDAVDVQPAQLGDDAPLWGACALVI